MEEIFYIFCKTLPTQGKVIPHTNQIKFIIHNSGLHFYDLQNDIKVTGDFCLNIMVYMEGDRDTEDFIKYHTSTCWKKFNANSHNIESL